MPSRPSDDSYSYTWSWWSPKVTPAYYSQTYTATFEEHPIVYTVDFDLRGGFSPSYTGPISINKLSKDNLFFDCSKDGYIFRGWSYKEELIFDEDGNQLAYPTMVDGMILKAEYSQTARLKIVTNIEEAGSISGSGEYSFYSLTAISAHPYQGYKFVGWYHKDLFLSSEEEYNYMIWDEDAVLEARFKLASYKIDVYSNNQPNGLVLLKSDLNNEFRPEYQEKRDCLSNVSVIALS